MYGTKLQRSRGHISAIVATAICAAAALFLLLNRQYVVDQLSVWQYQPSSEVVKLAERSGMNDHGKFYFYASKPAIEPAQEFNQECDRKEEGTAILGCYNGQNIYIYNVSNDKLDGIKEVTAAHEMLHAVYVRLGNGEKKALDALLEDEYSKLKDDSEFAERMAFYARTEPGERDNELHSVIGTEVAHVSPQLEAHYRQYFASRTKVVALHEQYAKVFDELKSKGATLSNELTELGDKIERESAQYNDDVSRLNGDISDFNSRADGGGFSNQAAFESERASLVARAEELDGRRDAINADITRYNSLRQELAAVSSQSQALNRSIDSSLAPAPSL